MKCFWRACAVHAFMFGGGFEKRARAPPKPKPTGLPGCWFSKLDEDDLMRLADAVGARDDVKKLRFKVRFARTPISIEKKKGVVTLPWIAVVIGPV